MAVGSSLEVLSTREATVGSIEDIFAWGGRYGLARSRWLVIFELRGREPGRRLKPSEGSLGKLA